ncbi:MAG: S8 family serine peptidase [Ferruginibacter sp.]
MKKLILLLLVFTTTASISFSQTRYIVKLKDKAGTPFSISSPGAYLTARSIARRTRYNIAIDSTDLPITPRYIDSIRLAGAVTILNVSKWLNQVCIQTSDATAITKINSFTFVSGTIVPVGSRTQAATAVNKQLDAQGTASGNGTFSPLGTNDFYNYGQSYGQVHLHSAEFLHNHGFRGQGMQLAVLDAGFYHYLSLPTFDSIRNNGQVLGTWDFVAGNASVDEDDSHGMDCLSTIAANLPGTFVGTAPKTSFYLFRTEDAATENPVEEQNWAAGAERADSLGVDVFSTSLGYTTFDNPAYNHTYADMNGNTTIMAKACDYAAKKGIISVLAAGNDGTSAWHYISTAADADSGLTVGAVATNRQVANFSSYGPTSDGQIKPDVAATGLGAIIANPSNGQPTSGNGTSFACPNMAGITTCLWQAFPEVNNMDVIDALRKSGDRYTTPDDRTGYGIPDAKNAYVRLLKKLYTQTIAVNNCKTNIQFNIKGDTSARFVIERKLATEAGFSAIANLQASGTYAAKTITYDDDLSAIALQTIRYRIKMSISADTTFYLDSATVNYNTSCGNPPPGATEKITIGPNPVKDNLFINIVRNNAVSVKIVLNTTAGQKIYSLENQQPAGTQIYTIPVKGLARAVYYITVFINDKKEVTKKLLLL